MRKVSFSLLFAISCVTLFAQNFSVPSGAVLIESNVLKDKGVPYLIEQRYRLPDGSILYAYYDSEGNNSQTIQKIEKAPLIAVGKNIITPGMPGFREFKFTERRDLIQFMKIMKLGIVSYFSNKTLVTPTINLYEFETTTIYYTFTLSLDLYDNTWLLEKIEYDSTRAFIIGNDSYDIRVMK